jgi:hypothetical protein
MYLRQNIMHWLIHLLRPTARTTGLPISVTMVACSSAWHGTALELTVSRTAVAAEGKFGITSRVPSSIDFVPS